MSSVISIAFAAPTSLRLSRAESLLHLRAAGAALAGLIAIGGVSAHGQQVNNQSFNGTGTISGSGAVTLSNGATFQANGSATVSGTGSITPNSAGAVTATITGGATATVNCTNCAAAPAGTYRGSLNTSGTGSVTIPGKGTLTGSGTLTAQGQGTITLNGRSATGSGQGTLTLTGTLTGSPAAVDPSAIVAKDVVLPLVQTSVEYARERMFDVRDRASGVPTAPLGYAADASSAIAEQVKSPFGALDPAQFQALGYTTLPTKKSPPPVAPPVVFASWGSGTFDYERVGGFFQGQDISSVTRSGGGLAGADWTVTLPGGAYFLGGILAGDTTMSINTPGGVSTRVQAPTVGVYAAYLIGGFSVDGLYTSTWIDANSTFQGGTLQQNAQSNNFAANVQYRIPLQNNWWFEPTAGASYTYTFESGGVGNEEILRLQGGARLGGSAKWGSVIVEPTLTGMLYSDVITNGGGQLQGFTPVAADRGQLWAKGGAKLNFVLSPNLSVYIQNEIHGTRGTEREFGYIATAGLRLNF